MATTRKARARTNEGQFQADDPATPDRNEACTQDMLLDVDSLAEFIGDQQPDRDRLEQALSLAKDAALNFTGIAVADTAPHPIRQGIFMLAAKLLITNQIEESPATDAIPLVVRYFWRAAGAGRQSV